MEDLDESGGGGQTSRKGFLARATAAAAAAVGVFGGWIEPARAYSVVCCELALGPPFCSSPSGCPSGWVRSIWHCCQNGVLYQCMECNKGGTCYDGPFLCSRYDAVYQC